MLPEILLSPQLYNHTVLILGLSLGPMPPYKVVPEWAYMNTKCANPFYGDLGHA